jgi:hypothetical protein
MALQPFVDLGRFFRILILYTVGRIPSMGDQPVARPLPAHRTIRTQNKRTQTSMPWVEFEPTIPMLERAKTVHALNRAATVIGWTMELSKLNRKELRWARGLFTGHCRLKGHHFELGLTTNPTYVKCLKKGRNELTRPARCSGCSTLTI